MDRRTALLFTMASLAAGCGGGGGNAGVVADAGAQPGVQPSGPPPSAPSPSPSPPDAGLSPNIVAWGDSMTPAFALNLQVLEPDRVVIEQGFLGQTSTVIEANQLADTAHRNWINVFWYGHNDFRVDPASAPQTIKAKLAASIAHLAPGNTRFVVLSVVNNAYLAPEGTDLYWSILKLNSELAALYPDNYIDIRAWLVAHPDPGNPQDVIDAAQDVPPTSLRYDEIHLRNPGSVLVAQRVRQFIDSKGW
jgi:hypothetical protein